MEDSAYVVSQKEGFFLGCFLCALVLWKYVDKATVIWFGKDLWESSPEGEVEKGEERIHTKAGVTGRDREHKAVGHSDKRTDGERGDNGRAVRN